MPASARWARRSAGFFHLTGWPDRPPCGPFGAYSDYPSPRFALCAAARRPRPPPPNGRGPVPRLRPGRGVRALPAPAVLDQAVNGRESARQGNADPMMAPHGVYPSAGDDAWVAIACRDDADWSALAGVLGRPDLAGLPVADRLRPARRARRRRRAVDGRPHARRGRRRRHRRRRPGPRRAELRRVLRRPAAAAPRALGHPAPPRARHDHRRGLSRIALVDTPADVSGIPPFLGQDTVDVLTGLLGYDDERLGDLFAAGALD